jgi:DivIVA domain-containing protein
MTTMEGMPRPGRQAQRLTPEQLRSTRFSRTAIGRRGYSEEEVQRFLRRVAEEIATRDAAEASLRAEVDRFRTNLRQWQAEYRDRTGAVVAVEPAGFSVEAVNLLSQAQQQADAYVAEAQNYSRQVMAHARNQADEILREAQAHAEAAGDEAVRSYRARAGGQYAAEYEELERRLAWTRTFLGAIQSVEAQLRSAREALSFEVDKLADLGPFQTPQGQAPQPSFFGRPDGTSPDQLPGR